MQQSIFQEEKKNYMDEKPSISQHHIEDKKKNHQIQLSVLIIILMTMKIFATIFETPTLWKKDTKYEIKITIIIFFALKRTRNPLSDALC